MDSHHAQERLAELHRQAEIARALRSHKPRWYRQLARTLVRLARTLDQETVSLELASR